MCNAPDHSGVLQSLGQLEEEEDGKKVGTADLCPHLCPVARRRLEAGLCMRRLARPDLRSAAPGLSAAAASPAGTAELPSFAPAITG